MTIKRPLTLIVSLAIVATAACTSTRRSAPTPNTVVDQIVASALVARGGLPRVRSIRSERLAGYITIDGRRQRFLVEIERGGHMRQEIGPVGAAMIETTNGTTGWLVDPTHGVREARALSTSELANLAGGADLDGPFVDYRSRGIKIELLGTEMIDGSQAYRFRVTMPDGTVRYQDVDSATHLDVKWQGTVHTPSGDRIAQSYFRDYRRVDGVPVAFAIESWTEDVPGRQQIVLERVDINPSLDPARFGKP